MDGDLNFVRNNGVSARRELTVFIVCYKKRPLFWLYMEQSEEKSTLKYVILIGCKCTKKRGSIKISLIKNIAT